MSIRGIPHRKITNILLVVFIAVVVISIGFVVDHMDINGDNKGGSLHACSLPLFATPLSLL